MRSQAGLARGTGIPHNEPLPRKRNRVALAARTAPPRTARLIDCELIASPAQAELNLQPPEFPQGFSAVEHAVTITTQPPRIVRSTAVDQFYGGNRVKRNVMRNEE